MSRLSRFMRIAFHGVAVAGLLLATTAPILAAPPTKGPVQAIDDPTGSCDLRSVEQIGGAVGHVAPPSSSDAAAVEGADPGLVLWNSRLWIWDGESQQYLQVGTVQRSMGGSTITLQTYDDPWPPGQSCYSMCRAGTGTFWQCWYYCGFLRNP